MPKNENLLEEPLFPVSLIKAILVFLSWAAIGILAFIGGATVYDNTFSETENQYKRLDLLNCQGEVFGTFYYNEADQEDDRSWVSGTHAKFIDYRGREIQYSGNYLVTPIPDTLSINNDQ